MASAFGIMAIVFAIAATVLAFIFIVPDKKRAKLPTFGKIVHDIITFKFLIVEKIMQALYIFCTAYTILIGFFMLFIVEYGYWYGGYGLLTMILGPIVVRLVYESILMFILLVKNVIQINGKLKGNADTNAAPSAAPSFDGYSICPHCGARKEGRFCPRCGKE